MLVNDKEALARINSPLNLINKMRSSNGRSNAMGLFGINSNGNKEVKPEQTLVKASPPFNPFDKSNKPSPPATELPPGEATPKLDDLIENSDNQIKLAEAHNKALDTLGCALDQLKTKLDDIKPEKLPSVIAATSKVVEGIRKERNDAAKNNGNRSTHFHFYVPEQRKIETYEVIDV